MPKRKKKKQAKRKEPHKTEEQRVFNVTAHPLPAKDRQAREERSLRSAIAEKNTPNVQKARAQEIGERVGTALVETLRKHRHSNQTDDGIINVTFSTAPTSYDSTDQRGCEGQPGPLTQLLNDLLDQFPLKTNTSHGPRKACEEMDKRLKTLLIEIGTDIQPSVEFISLLESCLYILKSSLSIHKGGQELIKRGMVDHLKKLNDPLYDPLLMVKEAERLKHQIELYIKKRFQNAEKAEKEAAKVAEQLLEEEEEAAAAKQLLEEAKKRKTKKKVKKPKNATKAPDKEKVQKKTANATATATATEKQRYEEKSEKESDNAKFLSELQKTVTQNAAEGKAYLKGTRLLDMLIRKVFREHDPVYQQWKTINIGAKTDTDIRIEMKSLEGYEVIRRDTLSGNDDVIHTVTLRPTSQPPSLDISLVQRSEGHPPSPTKLDDLQISLTYLDEGRELGDYLQSILTDKDRGFTGESALKERMLELLLNPMSESQGLHPEKSRALWSNFLRRTLKVQLRTLLLRHAIADPKSTSLPPLPPYQLKNPDFIDQAGSSAQSELIKLFRSEQENIMQLIKNKQLHAFYQTLPINSDGSPLISVDLFETLMNSALPLKHQPASNDSNIKAMLMKQPRETKNQDNVRELLRRLNNLIELFQDDPTNTTSPFYQKDHPLSAIELKAKAIRTELQQSRLINEILIRKTPQHDSELQLRFNKVIAAIKNITEAENNPNISGLKNLYSYLLKNPLTVKKPTQTQAQESDLSQCKASTFHCATSVSAVDPANPQAPATGTIN